MDEFTGNTPTGFTDSDDEEGMMLFDEHERGGEDQDDLSEEKDDEPKQLTCVYERTSGKGASKDNPVTCGRKPRSPIMVNGECYCATHGKLVSRRATANDMMSALKSLPDEGDGTGSDEDDDEVDFFPMDRDPFDAQLTPEEVELFNAFAEARRLEMEEASRPPPVEKAPAKKAPAKKTPAKNNVSFSLPPKTPIKKAAAKRAPPGSGMDTFPGIPINTRAMLFNTAFDSTLLAPVGAVEKHYPILKGLRDDIEKHPHLRPLFIQWMQENVDDYWIEKAGPGVMFTLCLGQLTVDRIQKNRGEK